jgi:hypothetical protein
MGWHEWKKVQPIMVKTNLRSFPTHDLAAGTICIHNIIDLDDLSEGHCDVASMTEPDDEVENLDNECWEINNQLGVLKNNYDACLAAEGSEASGESDLMIIIYSC